MREFTWYSFAKILSYNCKYNLAVGGRGIGKTFGAKKHVIKNALKRGAFGENIASECLDQFIYLRRYKEELKLAKRKFFADIITKNVFPDYDFRDNGDEAQASPASERDKKSRKWLTIGYFIALSLAQNYKSVSFPNVKTIIFDEFILEKSATRYLPDEATIFNNFYSTVDRYQGKTRVLMLANAVGIDNPYFIEWSISPDDMDENGFVRIKNQNAPKFGIVEFIDDEKFTGEVLETEFGAFIKDSDYAQYAVHNVFKDNHKHLIGDKPSRAKYMYTLDLKDATFSVWFDSLTRVWYCQKKRPKNEVIITTQPSKMDETKTLMTYNDRTLSVLRTAFRTARVMFDIPATRNAFLEVMKR